MVNPKAGGAGEGNNNGDKGKGKMVFPSVTSMDDIPDLQKYELLAESLHKQMLDIKAWTEASEASKLLQQIEKARKQENEFEVLQQHEERERIKLLQKVESLRSERRQLMQQVKMELEDNLKAKADEDTRLKYEELMKKMSVEISVLKVGENSGQGGMKRERECVMCLSLEKTVLFLPCAHLALCQECNVLHERQGMNECPTCGTPIVQRISVRFPPPPAR